MYKNIHNFIPFQHENAEAKNNLIGFARSQDRSTPEGAFSATLIYANLVEYIARHLLENLYKMNSIYTFRQFGGVFHLDCSSRKMSVPLNQLQSELGMFEFPGKRDFLEDLQEFKELRNRAMHSLMQLDSEDSTTGKIDRDLNRISELAEDILAKYNTIVSGLVSIWNTANAQKT